MPDASASATESRRRRSSHGSALGDRQRIVRLKADQESGRERRGSTVGSTQETVEVALGRRQQTTVEFLAQHARLFAWPVDGQQHFGQFGVAQQEATVVVNQQQAQQARVFVVDADLLLTAQIPGAGTRSASPAMPARLASALDGMECRRPLQEGRVAKAFGSVRTPPFLDSLAAFHTTQHRR